MAVPSPQQAQHRQGEAAREEETLPSAGPRQDALHWGSVRVWDTAGAVGAWPGQWPRTHTREGPTLVQHSADTILEFLIVFEPGASRVPFAVSPTNDTAGSVGGESDGQALHASPSWMALSPSFHLLLRPADSTYTLAQELLSKVSGLSPGNAPC